jgi:hypothetical protein
MFKAILRALAVIGDIILTLPLRIVCIAIWCIRALYHMIFHGSFVEWFVETVIENDEIKYYWSWTAHWIKTGETDFLED